MNILIVTDSTSSFNSIRPEGEMFIEFARRGHLVTILTQANSEYGRRYEEEGLRVVDVNVRKKLSLHAIGTIRRELQARRYDILYATNSKAIPNSAFAALGNRVKLVTYRGTTGGLYRHDPSAYLTHLHPRVDGVACVSEAVREDVASRVWSHPERVVAIHKGHRLEWYQVKAADLAEFGISGSAFVVICAVNARPSKGIPVMLEAAELLADLPDLHLLLVGKNMDSYQEQINGSQMRERIHVTGYRHDVPSLITAADVLVQPSISGEGLPRAVMEAMGCGTPQVITTAGGGKEVVLEGGTGFVVPTQRADLIAERIRKLYHDRSLLKEMSVKGRQRMAEEFSCARSAERYLEFFQQLCTA